MGTERSGARHGEKPRTRRDGGLPCNFRPAASLGWERSLAVAPSLVATHGRDPSFGRLIRTPRAAARAMRARASRRLRTGPSPARGVARVPRLRPNTFQPFARPHVTSTAQPTTSSTPDSTGITSSSTPGNRAAANATTFAHRMWRIAAAHVSGGNACSLLHDGPATFDAMLALIAGAREEVALESYILRSDAVGRRFAPALADAARRGVQVRVLYDWLGSRGITGAFVAELRDAGVDVRAFNPPKLGARWLGVVPRDHRKLLVVDPDSERGAGITGGVGLGHEWSEGEHPGRPGSGPWRDTAVQIAGPAARSMAHAFERTWALTPHYVRKHPEVSRPTTAPGDAPGAPGEPDATGVVGIVEGEPGRYRVSRALQAVAVEAQRSIWIADAYFTPSPDLIEALTGAARDGVDVRLLVPGRGDHAWVVPVTRRYYPRLRRNGVRIWEWEGEMMHAKSQVSDGRYARVGSTDFNPLGVAINFELDAVVDDAALGARMEAMFEDDLARSREVKA